MATFNGSQFLAEQIDSILNQSRPADEIIIVDDASTDNTVSLIQAYQIQHPIIHLLISPNNQGSNKAFDTALRSSTGSLIFISDQDDVWLPEKIDTMVKDWEMNRKGLICSDGCIIDRSGKITEASELHFHGMQTVLKTQEALIFANTYSGHNMMLERQLLLLAQPFPEGPIYDHWLAIVASGSAQLRYLPKALTQHRIHGGNQVNGRPKHQRPSKIERFERSRHALYQLANAILALPHQQPAMSIALVLTQHAKKQRCILSLSTLLRLFVLREHLFPNSSPAKRLRLIKNYALGPLGYFL